MTNSICLKYLRKCLIERTIKERHERYTEFLDAAQRLFFTQGYEQTSVQDIIRAVGVAKGTFYHYFETKAALLDALVLRMYDQRLALLRPLMEADDLSALDKLSKLFHDLSEWKTDNKALMIHTMRVLYHDDNLPLRQKMNAAVIEATAPLLTQIIEQGVREGVFDVAYPRETALILLSLGDAFRDQMIAVILGETQDPEAIAACYRFLEAYNHHLERILGMTPGTFTVVEPHMLDEWLP